MSPMKTKNIEKLIKTEAQKATRAALATVIESEKAKAKKKAKRHIIGLAANLVLAVGLIGVGYVVGSLSS